MKKGIPVAVNSEPNGYENWREDDSDRAEDAAYVFGYHLITKCKDEAMDTLPEASSDEVKEAVEKAVNTALHNVMDMLEGFWKLEAGQGKSIELILGVRVHDENDAPIETIELSPCKLDLPIGYWKWANDREFK